MNSEDFKKAMPTLAEKSLGFYDTENLFLDDFGAEEIVDFCLDKQRVRDVFDDDKLLIVTGVDPQTWRTLKKYLTEELHL